MPETRSQNMNMPYTKALIGLIVSSFMFALASSPTQAVTPQEAFAKGCGGCHASERKILRRIPAGSGPVRRSWIEKFMANHPNESGALKSEILEYLMEKSAASKKWWQP
jgi:hypothetical protein